MPSDPADVRRGVGPPGLVCDELLEHVDGTLQVRIVVEQLRSVHQRMGQVLQRAASGVPVQRLGERPLVHHDAVVQVARKAQALEAPSQRRPEAAEAGCTIRVPSGVSRTDSR